MVKFGSSTKTKRRGFIRSLSTSTICGWISIRRSRHAPPRTPRSTKPVSPSAARGALGRRADRPAAAARDQNTERRARERKKPPALAVAAVEPLLRGGTGDPETSPDTRPVGQDRRRSVGDGIADAGHAAASEIVDEECVTPVKVAGRGEGRRVGPGIFQDVAAHAPIVVGEDHAKDVARRQLERVLRRGRPGRSRSDRPPRAALRRSTMTAWQDLRNRQPPSGCPTAAAGVNADGGGWPGRPAFSVGPAHRAGYKARHVDERVMRR